jgi:hypothetical protein
MPRKRIVKANCLNCQAFTLTYRRGLCKKCYDVKTVRVNFIPKRAPAVRDMICAVCHNLRSRVSHTNDICRSCRRAISESKPIVDDTIDLPLAPIPTCETPGTKEKIEIMAKRAENGYAVFHPRDKTIREWLAENPT